MLLAYDLGFCSKECVRPNGRLDEAGFLVDGSLKPSDASASLNCTIDFGLKMSQNYVTCIMSHAAKIFGGNKDKDLVVRAKFGV